MTIVTPQKPRYQTEAKGTAFEITIRGRKRWWALILQIANFFLLTVFLSVMGVILLFALSDSSGGSSRVLFGIFALVIFLIWLYGCGFTLYGLLWLLTGKEIVTAEPDRLTINRRTIGLNRKKIYLAEYINNLRVSPRTYIPYTATLHFWDIFGGIIVFDYGVKTYRFGLGIEEAEAKLILADIVEHLTLQKPA